MPTTLRTFVAIQFSPTLRQGLGSISQRLAANIPPRTVTWVQPDIIHLTLKFLGDTPESALPSITAALQTVAANTQPIHLVTSQPGCFANLRRPRVVWLGLNSAAASRLVTLQQAIESALTPLGFPPEARHFSPHITLGRVRREAPATAAAILGDTVQLTQNLPPLTDTITSLVFIQSDLKPAGPVYTTRFTAEFANA